VVVVPTPEESGWLPMFLLLARMPHNLSLHRRRGLAAAPGERERGLA
jgi:hypothetical protein